MAKPFGGGRARYGAAMRREIESVFGVELSQATLGHVIRGM
jgi:hypothetical protein